MVAGGLIPDGFVSPAFAAEHRMLGFDVLVRAGCRCDSDELGEQLPTEYTVVLQSLIAAFELGNVRAGALASGVPRVGAGRIRVVRWSSRAAANSTASALAPSGRAAPDSRI